MMNARRLVYAARMRGYLWFVIACGSQPAIPADPPKPSVGGDEKLTGTITEINFGCAIDASCDLVIDGKARVHFGHDTRGEHGSPWGHVDDGVWNLMREDPNK